MWAPARALQRKPLAELSQLLRRHSAVFAGAVPAAIAGLKAAASAAAGLKVFAASAAAEGAAFLAATASTLAATCRAPTRAHLKAPRLTRCGSLTLFSPLLWSLALPRCLLRRTHAP